MNKYGDPGFHYHVTAARLWALLTAKLAESPVISLNATDYADALIGYIEKVEAKLHSVTATEEEDLEARARPIASAPKGDFDSLALSFKKLTRAAHKLKYASVRFDAYASDLAEQAGTDIPWWKWLSKLKLFYDIKKVNDKYKYLERAFLYQKGLDGRSWFKHIVFAPGLWTGYSGAVFPGLVESLDAKDWTNAERWVGIIEGSLKNAKKGLAL